MSRAKLFVPALIAVFGLSWTPTARADWGDALVGTSRIPSTWTTIRTAGASSAAASCAMTMTMTIDRQR